MELPTLYKIDKAERIRYWECKVDGSAFYTRAGLLKTRDTHKWQEHKRPARYTPGHGGYRTPEEIAQEHALSMWKEKKRNDAMTESISDLESGSKKYPIPIAPVLAMKYNDLLERHENPNSKYKFPETPYWIQPKLDGERCTASYLSSEDNTCDVHLFSRLRNEIPHCEHIKKILKKIYIAWGKNWLSMFSCTFDGEIIEEKDGVVMPRNQMRSAISRIKSKHQDNNKLVYHVFDLVTTPEMPFSKRYEILERIMSKVNSKHLKLVPILAKATLGTSEVDDAMAIALGQKYEGIIMRDPNMKYPVSNLRISQMIKYKPNETIEWKIIGAHEGTDAHKGLIIWQCADPQAEYITQDITPSWTFEERKRAWIEYQEDPTQFIGSMLTILYREKNEYGRLVEARGIGIRDPDDMSVAENQDDE